MGKLILAMILTVGLGSEGVVRASSPGPNCTDKVTTEYRAYGECVSKIFDRGGDGEGSLTASLPNGCDGFITQAEYEANNPFIQESTSITCTPMKRNPSGQGLIEDPLKPAYNLVWLQTPQGSPINFHYEIDVYSSEDSQGNRHLLRDKGLLIQDMLPEVTQVGPVKICQEADQPFLWGVQHYYNAEHTQWAIFEAYNNMTVIDIHQDMIPEFNTDGPIFTADQNTDPGYQCFGSNI